MTSNLVLQVGNDVAGQLMNGASGSIIDSTLEGLSSAFVVGTVILLGMIVWRVFRGLVRG